MSKTFPSHPRPPLLTSPPGGPLTADDGWAGGGDWLWGQWKLLSKGGNCSQRSPSGESEGGKVSPHIREGSIFLERHSPGQRAQAGSWKELALTSEMDCPALLSSLLLLKAGPALLPGEAGLSPQL